MKALGVAQTQDAIDARRYRTLRDASKCYWITIHAQPSGDIAFDGQPSHSLDDALDSIDAQLAGAA